jgi:hypothetical protein
LLGIGVPVAQAGELMGYQGVLGREYVGHGASKIVGLL